LLLVQVGSRAFVVAFEFGVALPDRAAVLAVGVPDLGTVETAAVSADDAGGEYAFPAIASSQSPAPCKLFLDGIPFIRLNDRLMAVLLSSRKGPILANKNPPVWG